MVTWYLFANIMETEWSPYTKTNLWVYGPIWAYVIKIVNSVGVVFLDDPVKNFQVNLSVFLGIIDICTSAVIYSIYGIPGFILLFFPLSIHVSSTHIQFDNIAVLLGLISWLIYLKSNGSKSVCVLAGVICGLSLAVKHVLIGLPFWVLFWDRERNKCERYIFFSVSLSALVVMFLPFLFDKESLAGILSNVLGFRSDIGRGLVPQFLDVFFPLYLVEESLTYLFDISILKALFLGLLIGIGYFSFQSNRRDAVIWYTVIIVVISPSTADQYLAIAAVGVALFYRNPFFWIYSLVSIFFIYKGPLLSWIYFGLELGSPELLKKIMLSFEGNLDYWHLQSWLLFAIIFHIRRYEPTMFDEFKTTISKISNRG